MSEKRVRCLICGRVLSNPESVERKIGPVCREKHRAKEEPESQEEDEG